MSEISPESRTSFIAAFTEIEYLWGYKAGLSFDKYL
jgi:hypothetical protein